MSDIETIGTYQSHFGYVTVSVEQLENGRFAVLKESYAVPGRRQGHHVEAELACRDLARRFAEVEVLARGGSIGQTGEALLCGEVQWAARERLRLDTKSRRPKRFLHVPAEPGTG